MNDILEQLRATIVVLSAIDATYMDGQSLFVTRNVIDAAIDDISRLRAENERLSAIQSDPVAVELNMKRGRIAQPSNLVWMTDEQTPFLHERNNLRDEVNVLKDALNHAWNVVFPAEPDGWEYPAQVGNHIGSEINRLRAEVSNLHAELAIEHRAADCWRIVHGDSGPCSGNGGCDCSPDNDTAEPLHLCGYCGAQLQEVRPGKWQCDACEGEET